jgi:cellulose synthase/poly-beta-1,6-N-acetylglucosamine synthase-like glycosyltransferase
MLLFFIFSVLATQHIYTEQIFPTPIKKRVLVGSPIRQKPMILKEFLQSLTELNTELFEISYFFIDDNDNSESIQILNNFLDHNRTHCIIARPSIAMNDIYICDEKTHYWPEQTIWKVAAFKDTIIDWTLKNTYDYLFLVDSDIVLHPQTINQLIKANKDIVSNIFWTMWQPDTPKLPQVWLSDEYTQFQVSRYEHLTSEIVNQRKQDFLQLMLTPGTHEVGGLGACTLISKNALAKGVNFKKIKNITFWGEDRHFCVRAAALGIELFVDTHYPAYHIYRETNLSGVAEFKENCIKDIYQI